MGAQIIKHIFLLITAISLSLFAEQARVEKVINRAERRPPGGEWQKLRLGFMVDEGDTIKTHDNSQLIIKFNSGSIDSLGANTCQVLVKLSEDEKMLQQIYGISDSDVKKKEKRYVISTPVSSGGTEGTRFKVIVDKETGATRYILYSGRLRITGLSESMGSVLLMPNQQISVNRESGALAPQPLPPQAVPIEVNEAGPGDGAGEEASLASGDGEGDGLAGGVDGEPVLEESPRLEQSAQNATGGFIQQNTEEKKNQVTVTPQDTRKKGWAVINITYE